MPAVDYLATAQQPRYDSINDFLTAQNLAYERVQKGLDQDLQGIGLDRSLTGSQRVGAMQARQARFQTERSQMKDQLGRAFGQSFAPGRGVSPAPQPLTYRSDGSVNLPAPALSDAGPYQPDENIFSQRNVPGVGLVNTPAPRPVNVLPRVPQSDAAYNFSTAGAPSYAREEAEAQTAFQRQGAGRGIGGYSFIPR